MKLVGMNTSDYLFYLADSEGTNSSSYVFKKDLYVYDPCMLEICYRDRTVLPLEHHLPELDLLRFP